MKNFMPWKRGKIQKSILGSMTRKNVVSPAIILDQVQSTSKYWAHFVLNCARSKNFVPRICASKFKGKKYKNQFRLQWPEKMSSAPPLSPFKLKICQTIVFILYRIVPLLENSVPRNHKKTNTKFLSLSSLISLTIISDLNESKPKDFPRLVLECATKKILHPEFRSENSPKSN